MAKYRIGWRYAAIVVAALGTSLTLLTQSSFSLLAAVSASAGIALCIALGVTLGQVESARSQRFRPVFTIAFVAALCAALLVVGALTLLAIVLLIVASSPPVVGRISNSKWPARHGSVRPAHATTDESTLSRMSRTALVTEWRRSYVELHRTADHAAKIALVDARAAYLDELERRDPEGLHIWLESGPLAVGDPTTYMEGGRDEDADGPSQAA